MQIFTYLVNDKRPIIQDFFVSKAATFKNSNQNISEHMEINIA